MNLRSLFKHVLIAAVIFIVAFFFLIHSKHVPELHHPDPEEKQAEEISTVCEVSIESLKKVPRDLPLIVFVTPTYSRREQVPELVRLSQTLLHIPGLLWIVAEDSVSCSHSVQKVFRRLPSLPFVHLSSPMPKIYEKEFYKPRGVSSRNAALEWMERNQNLLKNDDIIVYFGDDDNSYDLRLFDEIRSTKKVSMFPVGLIGDQGVSSPLVKNGTVVGFTDSWFESRHFPIDMAGFAFNWKTMVMTKKKKEPRKFIRMPYKAGHEEDLFLRALDLKVQDIEPKANNCTEILVWHTQTVKKPISNVKFDLNNGSGNLATSLSSLVQNLESLGILKFDPKGKELPLCFAQKCKTIKN